MTMKSTIYPDYNQITVACASCGNTFKTGSTLAQDLWVEICSNCHPFQAGTQKRIDPTGRIDRFRNRYASIRGEIRSNP
jgi:large subunit ribosomal protein L31